MFPKVLLFSTTERDYSEIRNTGKSQLCFESLYVTKSLGAHLQHPGLCAEFQIPALILQNFHCSPLAELLQKLFLQLLGRLAAIRGRVAMRALSYCTPPTVTEDKQDEKNLKWTDDP